MDETREYYSLIQTAFAKLAPYYDAIITPIAGLRRKTVDLADAKSGSTILDVATGTGAQALAFAERGYKVTGVDLSDAMLKVAQSKNRYADLKFQPADATNLPFENASFDVSTISFALHDMPFFIREKTLKEMVRVTKPQGIIMIVDYGLPKHWLGAFLVHHLIRLYEAGYYSEFIKSDLEALIQEAGIEIRQKSHLLLGGVRIIKGAKT